ncbi:MAG: hypothetical protein J0H71_05675 [Rhizobiales bacterium]|nr:hypothetical protein [Hyphomicrobiales bacterium]
MASSISKARRVLADVRQVREKLEDETGWIEWRLYWILAVTLLRAVGHVLDKVDGSESAKLRAVARRHYARWKDCNAEEHAIFRDFIDQERNSILKEYEFGMSEGPIPIMATLTNADANVSQIGALIEENVYRPMWSGPYEGEDGRTLIDEAIDWWVAQFDLIEEDVARL